MESVWGQFGVLAGDSPDRELEIESDSENQAFTLHSEERVCCFRRPAAKFNGPELGLHCAMSDQGQGQAADVGGSAAGGRAFEPGRCSDQVKFGSSGPGTCDRIDFATRTAGR